MANQKLFADADPWFADRGFTREKSKEPTWSKELGQDLELNLFCDPIPLSSGLYDTRFLYAARFPRLANLHSSLHLPNSKMGRPTGKLKGISLSNQAFHNAWRLGYEPLELSGVGPMWDDFFAQAERSLPEIEAELTTESDFRHKIETSQYWKVSDHRFSEMFILLHFEEWDQAQHLLDTTDWRKVVNPQNIADRSNKPTTAEDVENVTQRLAEYINTNRKGS